MRIQYVSSATVRIWDGLWFTPENGHTVEVTDANVVADLLTHPPSDFAVAEDEPLLTLDGMDRTRAAQLAMAGIASLDELAEVSTEREQELATEMNVDAGIVQQWVDGSEKIRTERAAALVGAQSGSAIETDSEEG